MGLVTVQRAVLVLHGGGARRSLPPPWLRAVPACPTHRRLFQVVATDRDLALATGAEVRWDREGESRASRSLGRLYRAARGALP